MLKTILFVKLPTELDYELIDGILCIQESLPTPSILRIIKFHLLKK